MYLAIVLHLPHIGTRESDDLVLHLIIIAVHGERHKVGKAERSPAPRQSEGIFRCLFRSQVRIPHAEVIEITERRYTEGVLVQGTYEELFLFPGLPGGRQSGR